MIDMIKRNLRRIKTVSQREISYHSLQPREVNLELTHRCNLKCKMCGVWIKGVDSSLQELTAAEYLDLFQQMKNIGVRLVTLTGGEPFIRKDLFDIVEAAKSKGLICNVFTNGTLIDDLAVERIFGYGIDKIIVSIDGLGPIHDSIRGVSGAFDKAIGALSNVVAERRSRDKKKPELDIHMTLLNENVGDITQLSILCQRLGVNFSFQPYSESNEQAVEQTLSQVETIRSLRYMPHDETLRFSEEDIRQIRREVAQLPVTFYTRLLSSFTDEDLRYGVISIKKCYITRNFMMVDPYGNVFPCTNLDRYIVGNVRNESLERIWRGERYAALRTKLSQHLLPACTHCCHCADNLDVIQLIKIILRST